MAEHYLPTPEELERLKRVIRGENDAAGRVRRCGGWHQAGRDSEKRAAKTSSVPVAPQNKIEDED